MTIGLICQVIGVIIGVIGVVGHRHRQGAWFWVFLALSMVGTGLTGFVVGLALGRASAALI